MNQRESSPTYQLSSESRLLDVLQLPFRSYNTRNMDEKRLEQECERLNTMEIQQTWKRRIQES